MLWCNIRSFGCGESTKVSQEQFGIKLGLAYTMIRVIAMQSTIKGANQ